MKQFWGDVLGKLLICDSCGPRPETLCMDGVAIDMMVENVKSQENLTLQENTSVVLAAPKYKDRVFIKQNKNRKMIRKSCDDIKIPDFRNINFSQDPGMLSVKMLTEDINA